MDKLSYFEEVGFKKEVALKLENLCIENNIPFKKMLDAIGKHEFDTYFNQKEIDAIFSVLNGK